jgi:hypothetical protein
MCATIGSTLFLVTSCLVVRVVGVQLVCMVVKIRIRTSATVSLRMSLVLGIVGIALVGMVVVVVVVVGSSRGVGGGGRRFSAHVLLKEVILAINRNENACTFCVNRRMEGGLDHRNGT